MQPWEHSRGTTAQTLADRRALRDESVHLSLRLGNAFFGSAGVAVAGYVRGSASIGDAAPAFLQMLSTMATFHERGLFRMFVPPVSALLSAAGNVEAAALLTGAGRVMSARGPVLTAMEDASQATIRAASGANTTNNS